MQYHLDMMKNRFKVIQGHDQYQRYKTIDQSRKISLHDSIHEKITKDKNKLREEMKKLNDSSDIKHKN